ncbi:MAG: DUF4231 domain-containing protein [Methanothrix sp.]
MYQFQSNWILYRSSCEGSRHEKYLWLAKAGHYADAKDPDRLHAKRIESLISTENAKWISAQEKVEMNKETHIVEKNGIILAITTGFSLTKQNLSNRNLWRWYQNE